MSKKVLILFAHPALHRSRVNKLMIESVRNLEHVTIHDLYEQYPDFHINIQREHELMEAHDIIVLHHPFFWYSCPPLLKEWIDLTFTLSWAYGPGGNALRGKSMVSAISTGGGKEAYQPTGYNRYTIPQLLAPFDQTAHLCGMTYLEPIVFHSADRASLEEAKNHAGAFRTRILDLRDGRHDAPFKQDWGT